MIYLTGGKKIRLSRLFKAPSKRALVVALDHGRRHGPIPGLVNLRETLKNILAAGVDAVMMTPAMIEHFSEILCNTFIIARIDGTGTVKSLDESDDRLISSVTRAISAGADAVSVMIYPGSSHESDLWEKLALVVEDARQLGVPVMAEIIPKPPVFENKYDPEAVAYGSRIAAEVGADIIKTLYTEKDFKKVVEGTPVPVLVLGGPRMKSPLDVLKLVENAVKEGAAGAAIGRNIFQFEKPDVMARALMLIIHEDLSAKEAARETGILI